MSAGWVNRVAPNGVSHSTRFSVILAVILIASFVAVYMIFDQNLSQQAGTTLLQEGSEQAVILTLPFAQKDLKEESFSFLFRPYYASGPNQEEGQANMAFELKGGSDILAAAAGEVDMVSDWQDNPELKTVKIRHDNNWFTFYAALEEISVGKNQKIQKGAIIGRSTDQPFIFSMETDKDSLCPTPYFAENDRAALLEILNRSVGPEGKPYQDLCYESES